MVLGVYAPALVCLDVVFSKCGCLALPLTLHDISEMIVNNSAAELSIQCAVLIIISLLGNTE